MITSLRLKNFKLFANQSWEFSNLNLLTGLNGMGKSTVIQALLLLREAYLYDRILLSKGLRLANNELFDNGLFDIGTVKDAKYNRMNQGEFIEIELGINEEKNFWAFSDRIDINEPYMMFLQDKKFDEAILEKASLFHEKKFVYLQAEKYVRNSYNIGQGRKNKFGNAGEFSFSFLMQNPDLPTFIGGKENAEPENQLAYQVQIWLNTISPNKKINLEKIGNQIELKYNGISAINEGYGLTYVLPIIITLLSAQEGDLIIIENPESHLHPKGQSKLAELMCLAAQNGVQIFCETHSDHILNGVRVASKQFYKTRYGIDSDLVNIHYFYTNEQNNSEVAHIKLDKSGKMYRLIENSKTASLPKGFFDEWSNSMSKLI